MEQNQTGVLDEDISLHIDSLEINKTEEKELIKEKVTEVYNKLPEIDRLIDEASDRWTLNRIAKIELALLRVAVYDMKFGEVPIQVAVNEAVELAKKYGEDQSSKFVNGILGHIAKKL